MRVLVGSDNDRLSEQIGEILKRHGAECPAGHVVSVDAVVGRAERVIPDLVVIVLPRDSMAGLEALRDIKRVIENAHILVVGPAVDAKLVLQVLQEGGDEYLDEALLGQKLSASLTRFKTRQKARLRRRQPGRVIAILAGSGGSGSSTLAANLSVVLATSGGECALLDLNLAAGDVGPMLDLHPDYTVADLCDHLARVDQSMFEQFFTRHHTGVFLLGAPGAFTDIQRVTCKGVRRTLSMARARFPYVVADLDNAFGHEQVEALWQSDIILLVVRLDYTSVRNVRRVMDHLFALGIGVDRVELIVNAFRSPKQLRVYQAEKALGKKVLFRLPYDPASVNRAINNGRPVVLHRPYARISKGIKDLALAVNGHFRPAEE
jgi:pilus assembly protein CpaE